MSRASSFLVVTAAGSLLLAACGGAAEAPAKAPASKTPAADEREPRSIAEAQEQIVRARAELGEAGGDEADKKAQAEPDSSHVSPGATRPSGDAASSSAVREERVAGAIDSCASSCRALSSMRRAVSALCRMTGEEDARCSDAKKTLGESESRVARCHCAP